MAADDHHEQRGGLAAHADLVAGHLMAESVLFRLTGEWSGDPSEPAAAVFFATQSSLHAWRAQGWADRAPRSVSPGAGADRSWESAATLAERLSTPVERLAAWVEVLAPSLLVDLRRHSARLDEPADAGIRRWLGITSGDLVRGWLEGVELLDTLTPDPDSLRSVAAVRTMVATPLLGRG